MSIKLWVYPGMPSLPRPFNLGDEEYYTRVKPIMAADKARFRRWSHWWRFWKSQSIPSDHEYKLFFDNLTLEFFSEWREMMGL
jgi:hypothetical protein